MSINVDKMDSKNDDSLPKSKPVMKRRKKNSSTSDLSSDSFSPKKHIPNGYVDDRSSPEITINSSYHSILTDSMNGLSSLNNTSNGHYTKHLMQHVDPVNDFNVMEVVSQNGSIRSVDSDSPSHMANVNHHYDDSDSASSVNKGSDGSGSGSGRRQPRTPEDFYLFCQFILEYANYNEMCSQDALRSSNHSPLDSTGDATESTTSSAVNEEESNHTISNDVDSAKELDGKNLDDSNVMMLNETSTKDVTKSMGAIDTSSTHEDDDSVDVDADSYNLVTCYCGKPYAARPMIECSQCLTWLHLSCAKIKRKNIPDIFICVKCAKTTGLQSSMIQQSMPNHPKDLQSNEPKENNRSKKSTASNAGPQTQRSDKIENNILQPLNVSAASYETGANNLENIKSTTTSTVSSIAVKYK